MYIRQASKIKPDRPLLVAESTAQRLSRKFDLVITSGVLTLQMSWDDPTDVIYDAGLAKAFNTAIRP